MWALHRITVYHERTFARRISGKILDKPALGEGTQGSKVVCQLLDEEPTGAQHLEDCQAVCCSHKKRTREELESG